MAIKKVKSLKDGTTGEYWRIVKESFNRLSNEASWEIALYKDQAARAAGKKPMNLSKVFKAALTSEERAQNRTQVGYLKIKQQAERQVPILGSEELVAFDMDLANGEDA